jgi:hypothetical protein
MRGKIPSSGRPPRWQREQLQGFWVNIAKGMSSEDAAIAGGCPHVLVIKGSGANFGVRCRPPA